MMRQVVWRATTLALVMGTAQSANAGAFDARGVFHLDENAVLSESFDSATGLVAKNLQMYSRQYQPLSSDASALRPYIKRSVEALEGEAFLLIPSAGRTGPGHFAIEVPALTGRLEVRLWTRAVPGTALLSVTYGAGGEMSFATIYANATGRRTGDDWIELTTGPIDSSVLGQQLAQVFVSGGYGGIAVDALEIIKLDEAVVAPDACTAAAVDSVCGADGECMLGTCVPATAVWGAVPYTEAHRREYLERLAHFFTYFHGNRDAVGNRSAAFRAAILPLSTTTSARLFWGGIQAAVHNFRDHHTNGPMSYGAYYTSLPSSLGAESSGALGACFGLTDLDLVTGGGRGYTVFRSDGTGGAIGTPLQVGDILDKIDGEPIAQWAARAGAWGIGSPSDARSDELWLAVELPGLISMRARDFEVLRCESTTTCASPTRVTIPVAAPLKQRVLQAGHVYSVVEPFKCDGRFKDSVDELRPPSEDGADVVSTQLRGDVRVFQFDGFSGNDAWQNAFQQALASDPAMVLFDTRLGNGGTGDMAQFLIDLLRDDNSPQIALGVARPWHELDPDGFYAGMMPCIEAQGGMLFDACSGTIIFATTTGPARGAGAKVAWLTSADVSANDYVPRFLQGREGLRIFGPGPTSGAFGAVVSLPPVLPGEYYGGSVQVHDTRFAASSDALVQAPYASGTGVTPDEIVTQKLSDLLAGQDTLLDRAHAWLSETP